MSGPLAGERILDLGTGLAAPFCAKLLADLGADVIKVERPGAGDPARLLGPYPGDRPDPEASAAFLYVNTSKRGITLDPAAPAGRELLTRLLQQYDVVIADGPAGSLAKRELGVAALQSINPAVILTTVSGFGSDGPYSDYLSTHLIACALGGWASNCGLPDREPLQAGGSLTDFIAGAYAAVATLIAIEGRARNGHGDHVDVSSWEATLTAALLPSLYYEYAGVIAERKSNRMTGPSFNMRCADGYVGVDVLTEAQWQTLCAFVGRPDLLEDPRYADPRIRIAEADAIRAELAPWFAQRKAEEVFHEAQTWRLPFGLVVSPQELFTLAPHRERGFFVQQEHPVAGAFPMPGVPFRMSATPSAPTRAPLLGEHDDEVNSEWPVVSRGDRHVQDSVQRTNSSTDYSLLTTHYPLTGVRIVDLSMFMSGPLVTLIAADMGADVVKVESLQRIDGWRGAAARGDELERIWEASPAFNWINRSKRDITLNLSDPRGAAVLKQLVATADVVVENYTPRVMANFGLGYEQLRDVNPRIIMLSMPGFGMTGSWRDYAAFAWTTEQMAAICQLTGYEDGEPLFTGTTGGDPLAGLMGAVALLAALNHQRRTGEGQFIDLSQVEASTSFVGDVLMEAALTGRNPTRRGNRNPSMAPHGIYPCNAGGWIAIACRSDDEWRALTWMMGQKRTEAAETLYPKLSERLQAVKELDAQVGAWTRTQDGKALMHRLQQAGIAAGYVMNGKDLLEDRHLEQRAFFIPQDRAEIGVKHYPGEPFRMANAALPEPRRSPYLGESNGEVLRDLLGLGPDALAELERDDVLGTVPIAAR